MERFLPSARESTMHRWQIQEAKARFSEFLERCLKEGPQLVTKRGEDAAVLVPIADWHRLQEQNRRTLKQLLLAGEPRFELPLPSRKVYRRRPAASLD
ncbi:MAG: type II toxin-antitoxin system Phd/YefM family antitoxin [Stellaceae bacterium]